MAEMGWPGMSNENEFDGEDFEDIVFDLAHKLRDIPENPDKLREILTGILRRLPGGMGVVSDGHHTIDDLYDHRRSLTACLAAIAGANDAAWRSRNHHPDDETPMFPGCFIVGIDLPTGQIRYHYGLDHWDEFSEVPEVPWSPVWDGAGPPETIQRLLAAAKLTPGL